MSTKRGRRPLAAVIAIVVVAAGGGGAWALSRSSSTTTTAATFTLVAATTGPMSQTVITTGTVAPAQQSTLTFSGSGSVTSVTAAVGLKVAKGAALASIDPTSATTTVTTATAAVTAAGEQVTAVAAGTAVQVAAAAAQLALAQVQLVRAQQALTATTLTAPFAGVVAVVGLAVGDVIGSSSGTGGGAGGSSATSSGITVITADNWLVNASVGSADLAQLRKGMQAQITPTGATAVVFGTVSSIGIVASATSGGSATFPVVIAVTGSPAGLYSGGSAAVSLIVRQLDDVLSVPTQALHTTGGATTVYQQVNGKQVITPVTVGTSYGPTTQILSGIATGDKVEVSIRGGFGGGRRSAGTGSTGTGGAQQPGNEPPGGFSGYRG